MVVIPPGTFTRGSQAITIDYPMAVGVYEVTFREWDACVRDGGCDGYRPSALKGEARKPEHPVTKVNWHDANRYAEWLTEVTGEEYGLLSEAEWEYAARAGSRAAQYWGDRVDQQCQYANGYDMMAHLKYSLDDRMPIGCRDGHEYTSPVGSYRPNAFGLYDVLGNVTELVGDCYNKDYTGAPVDGSARYTGDCTRRIFRGGSWRSGVGNLISLTARINGPTATRYIDAGFRVARTLERER